MVCGYSLGEGVNGALIPTDGIIAAARPFGVADENAYTEYGVAVDEDTGFGVAVMMHGDPSTGGAFVNVACRFGVVLAQPAKAKLLTNS